MDKYIDTLLTLRLPRWNELPDFELYMDQVISLMQKYLFSYVLPEEALTPSMINNYVKMDVLPAPRKKKYNKEHLAKLIVICLMKKQAPINAINYVMNEKVSANGLENFYNSFVNLYESALQDAANKAKEENDLLSLALTLSVTASANYIVAANAVAPAMPNEEKSPSDTHLASSAQTNAVFALEAY